MALADAELQLGENQAAVANYQKVLSANANAWEARIHLAQAYAQLQQWPEFDRERAALQTARDRDTAGLRKDGPDTLDVVHVGDRSYTAYSFYVPAGPHHTHYLFMRSGEDGKPVEAFTCDSDDGDQVAFREQFPQQAAAGVRRFSFDRWLIQADGSMQHQPVIALYDGEPPYEYLRGDLVTVVTALQKSAASGK